MRRLDPERAGAAATLAVRLPADLLAILDRETERTQSLVPGLQVTRSDALRAILARYRPTGADARGPTSPSREPGAPDPLRLRYLALRDGDANQTRPRAERLSNVSAARAAGCSEPTLRRWASGEASLPSGCARRLEAYLSQPT
jgi:hypothetical protein